MQTQAIQILNIIEHNPTFNNFITLDDNKLLITTLLNNSHHLIHIKGNKNTGKSHLLKAWIKNSLNGIYIDNKLANIVNIRKLHFHYNYIAIDDVDLLNNKQQIAIFDLWNSILNKKDFYLLTSAGNNFIRDDLSSRLDAGLSFIIQKIANTDLLTVLYLYAIEEHITIGELELKYLISNYSRDIGALINLLHKLSHYALMLHRSISIPLIKDYKLKHIDTTMNSNLIS